MIRWDHPRSRGDYSVRQWRKLWQKGSPPLTRGLLIKRRNVSSFRGITPAHAGTTWDKEGDSPVG